MGISTCDGDPSIQGGRRSTSFLAEAGQAFEDLERNAEEQYMQLSATVDTTALPSLVIRGTRGWGLTWAV